jgi:uncharacterized protein (TIGR00730 family)
MMASSSQKTGVPRRMKSIAVYCGSSPGVDPAFADAASSLGQLLARLQIQLVYGGGHVGLMGILADSALAEGGKVHGVITQALQEKEVAHQGLSELLVVESMHERKAAMAEMASGFVMLPGGLGTLEEFLEAATWTQLGIQSKPCGVLNVNGFFDPLLCLLETATQQRFVRPEHRDMVIIESDPAAMIERLGSWVPMFVDKWLDRIQI